MAPPSELEPRLDVHQLFSHYNLVYFSGALGFCIVKWSGRLTRIAGTCSYENDGRCEIRLAETLNKTHLVNDLKNTLLHEMIHAFLWNTQNDWDHSDHSPSFKALMDHINSGTTVDVLRPSGGYNITIYHKYQDADDNSKPHQWTCASCGDLIKRSINRAPSPFDCFKRLGHLESCGTTCHWHIHKNSCGGNYIKIAEPSRLKQKKQVSTSSEELGDDPRGGLLCLPSPNSAQKQNQEGLEEIKEDEPGSLSRLFTKKRSKFRQKVEEKENTSDVKSKEVAFSSPITKDASDKASCKKLDVDSSDKGKQQSTILANFSGVSKDANKMESSSKLDDSARTRENQNSAMVIDLTKCLASEIPREEPIGVLKPTTWNTRENQNSTMAIEFTKRLSSEIPREEPIGVLKPTTWNASQFFEMKNSGERGKEGQNFIKPSESKGLASQIPREEPKGAVKPVVKDTSEFFEKKNSGDRSKGYNVIIKSLNYYSDELTDEEIEPLINKRTERRKRLRLLAAKADNSDEMARGSTSVDQRVGEWKRHKVKEESLDGFGNQTTICCNCQNRASEGRAPARTPETVKVIEISDEEWSSD